MCWMTLTTLVKEKNSTENTIRSYVSYSNIAHNYKKNSNIYNNMRDGVLINIRMKIIIWMQLNIQEKSTNIINASDRGPK